AAAASETVSEIRALGVEALALGAELADAAAVVSLARTVEERTGGIHVLVNNASNYLRVPFDELTEAVWDASLDVNLKAPFLLAWALPPPMPGPGHGPLLNPPPPPAPPP